MNPEPHFQVAERAGAQPRAIGEATLGRSAARHVQSSSNQAKCRQTGLVY